MKLTAPQSEVRNSVETHIRIEKGQGLEISGYVCRGYCMCAIDRSAFFKQKSTEDVKILFVFPVLEVEDQSQ